MRFLPYLLLLLATACVPLGTPITDPNGTGRAPGQQKPPEYYADKTLRYQDYVYDPGVQSVQCYAATNVTGEVFLPPVVPVEQSQRITLEFDLLTDRTERLVTRLIHCDADWQPSVLTDMQFLSDINEFLITNYKTSLAGKVPYFHYRAQAPQVKISGNFLWVVQNSAGVPLISRRLLVFENRLQLSMTQGIVAGGDERYTMQQVDFAIGYAGVPLVNPAAEVKVVLRQNFRWDNAKYNLRPTFVRDAEQRLDYQYFNFENAFPGYSEFRYVDLRSLQAAGLGVQSINPRTVPTEVLLTPEESRAKLAYDQYFDTNGLRYFQSREYGNGDVNADYANVTFQLKAPQPAPGPVYVLGALSDWQLKEPFRLRYDEATQLYTGTALLKQGTYHYYYAVSTGATTPPDCRYFEGSHYETENQYDLLVYYRPPGTRTDLIIGYKSLDMNSRQ